MKTKTINWQDLSQAEGAESEESRKKVNKDCMKWSVHVTASPIGRGARRSRVLDGGQISSHLRGLMIFAGTFDYYQIRRTLESGLRPVDCHSRFAPSQWRN